MKRLLFICLVFYSTISIPQGFNDNKIALGNFLKRMYLASPFEGVKLVEDYDDNYLLSVISLDPNKYQDLSAMNRVASVKAQSQANSFINGSFISSEMIIKTYEKTANDSSSYFTEAIENIKQNSNGFIQGLELLINFNTENNRNVYIYFIKIKTK